MRDNHPDDSESAPSLAPLPTPVNEPTTHVIPAKAGI